MNTNTEFKDVPVTFTKRGFAHKQIKREKNVAIFSRSKNDREHYEVVILTPHESYIMAGIQFPAGISYPSSEMWGVKGWTYIDLNQAKRKYYELIEKIST